jgi:hypothetical protein
MPDPGRVRIQGWTLRHLIAAAYQVRIDQISGPAWMQDRYFDIEAKMPEGAKADQAHEMLRELLAERFGLALHRARRRMSPPGRLAQLAGYLTSRVGSPVTDETGIPGKYNVVIETRRATDDEPEQTVFDAVEKLGLKPSPRKVTTELLVIDRLSKTPAAN